VSKDFSLETSISKVARHTLADQVFSDVKELILSGRIAPGERLTLRRIAAAVGTSPMPVRDAVSRLVAEKALELLPNRSLQVSWPSRDRFEEIVLIRCNLEGLAAEQAANQRTASELGEILQYANEFERYTDPRNPNPAAAIRANRLMHFTIYRAARMPTLLQMIEGLWLQVGPVFWSTVSNELKLAQEQPAGQLKTKLPSKRTAKNSASVPNSGSLLAHTKGSHAELVQALAKQDGEAAKAAMVADIREAATKILSAGTLYDGEWPKSRIA
jgi:DNA-binding GntR family transcriptional regulator